MWSTCTGLPNIKMIIRTQIVFCLFTITFAAEHHYGSASQGHLNAHGEEELPDAIALTVADLAGYLVSNFAYNLSRAIMFIFWF